VALVDLNVLLDAEARPINVEGLRTVDVGDRDGTSSSLKFMGSSDRWLLRRKEHVGRQPRRVAEGSPCAGINVVVYRGRSTRGRQQHGKIRR